MARVALIGSVGSLLLLVAVACGDDDEGGGAGAGGDPSTAGAGGGGVNVGGSTAGNGLGGVEVGGQTGVAGHQASGAGGHAGSAGGYAGGAGGHAGGAGDAALAGQAGAGGESSNSAVTWLDDCDGLDLSADGTTVLATRGLWRATSGWVALPDLPGGNALVVPRALSRDGAVVFGNSGSSLGMELTRWEDGVADALGSLNTPYATNGDGSVAIGLTPIEPAASEGMNDDFDVFLWTEADGTDTLDQFWDAVGDGHVTDPSGMSFFIAQDSAAGVIGLQLNSNATSLRWGTTSMTTLSSERRIDALSPDGLVGAFRNAYLLTSPTAIYRVSDFTLLETPKCVIEPDPEDGFVKCHHVFQVLTGFDQSGERGVGSDEGPGIPPIAFFHWQQGEDAQNLVSFLAEQGVTLTLPESYSVNRARMSADGRTILGSLRTTLPAANRCFIASY